jgi:hypothetical protein
MSAPSFSCAHHRKRSSSSGGGISPLRKKGAVDDEDRDWESESESGVVKRRTRVSSPPPQSQSHLYAPITSYHRRGRSTDGNQKYIDYLERQVADLTNQLQEYTSATSSTSHAAKMRQLRAENRTLAHEVAEWEADFERRVNEEVRNNSAVDQSLRAAVAELEGRLEDREHSLRMANMEVKSLRRKCEQLAKVEEENRGLELRIQTMTELLTDSQRRTAAISPNPLESEAGDDAGEIGRRRASKESSYKGVEDYGITDPIDMLFSMDMNLERPASPASSACSPGFTNGPPRSPIPVPTSPDVRARRVRSAAKALFLPDPPSPHSDSGIGESERPSFEAGARSNPNRNSLFAELARVASDDEDSETEQQQLIIPRIEEPPSSVVDDIENPTPLIVKVISTVTSPTRTLGAAKRKAFDILGRGVDRVSQRRSQVLRSRRATIRAISPAAAVCQECGAPMTRQTTSKRSVVGGLRKRSGSVVQPVAEDGMDVIWLWVRFIIAVVVALGVAVKDGGPPHMVLDDGEGIDHVREEERELALKRLEGK